MALVKRVLPGAEIYYGVVYEGDEFAYEIERGRKRILKHVQRVENVKPDKILAAYCVIEDGDGRIVRTEVMTFEQIQRAWKQGQNYNENGHGTHQKFPDQMAIKTVVNRACKYVINSSSDDYLLLHHANRSDEVAAEEEMDEQVAADANGEVIDVTPEPPNGDPAPEEQAEILAAERAEAEGDERKQGVPEQQAMVGPGF